MTNSTIKESAAEKKLEQTYESLFKRAVAGDKEAMASISMLIQSKGGNRKYSLMEDLRQEGYKEYLDPKVKPSVKKRILNFFKWVWNG